MDLAAIGIRLRAIRWARPGEPSQAQVTKDLGLKPGLLSRLERGVEPDLDLLLIDRIAKYYEVPATFILEVGVVLSEADANKVDETLGEAASTLDAAESMLNKLDELFAFSPRSAAILDRVTRAKARCVAVRNELKETRP